MTDGGMKRLFYYDLSTLIFDGFWVMLPVYLYSCLIQDKVIKKVVVIMKVVVIGKRISSLGLYLKLWIVLSRTN